MVSTFRLTFLTELGERAEISIPRANVEVSDVEVITAMNEIISSGVVMTSSGKPIERLGARLVKTETTDFSID